MRRIQASTIAASAPPALEALQFIQRPPEASSVRVYAVGDVGLSGRVRSAADADSYAALFADIAPLTQEGNLVFGNLECPLVSGTSPKDMFAASPTAVPALADVGFTLLHVANNHILDYGPSGLTETLGALRAHQISALGAGEDKASAQALVRTDVGSLRIGWLGCGKTSHPKREEGPFIWRYDAASLLAMVRKVRADVDVLIVSMHIGFMYIDYPHPDHRELAHHLVREGAALVLMHHAHVLQGVQIIDQKGIVCYNLGNFIIDWQEGNVPGAVKVLEQQEGAVFAFDMDKQGVSMAAALPIWIDGSYRLRWATEEKGEKILNRLAQISKAIDGDSTAMFWKQRSVLNTGHTLKVLHFHMRRGNIAMVWREVRRIRREHIGLLLRWVLDKIRTFFYNPFLGRR